MALSPSIPTSFVPKQQAPQNPRRSSGLSVLSIIAVAVFVVTLALAGACFLYATYLKGVESSKGAQLVAAEKNVNPDTVQQMILLQNRLQASKGILDNHVELSQFFDLLESITLKDVRFTSLQILVASDRSATLSMSGVASSFNALAAQSKVFAAQPDIKSAIFSNIAINKDGTATFSVNASLDPKVVVEAAPPAGSSSAATATSSIAIPTKLPTLPLATTTASATSSAKAATTTP